MQNSLNISIRGLTIEDEPFLWEILYHAIYTPVGHQPFPRSIVYQPELAKYVRDWGRKGDEGFVAVDNSSLRVGAVWGRLFSATNKGYGYVSETIPELSIAMLPRYRNQGIGTELLCRFIEFAQSRYPAVSLNVSLENPAVRLYRAPWV